MTTCSVVAIYCNFRGPIPAFRLCVLPGHLFCDLKVGAVCSSETSAGFDVAAQKTPMFTEVFVTFNISFQPALDHRLP